MQNLDINPRDFSEAPRIIKEPRSTRTVIGLGLIGFLLLALLVYGSLPELSPKEIVAMDGYAGEQPTKHIFNLQSIEEAEQKNKSDVGNVAKSTADTTQSVQPVDSIQASTETMVVAKAPVTESSVNKPQPTQQPVKQPEPEQKQPVRSVEESVETKRPTSTKPVVPNRPVPKAEKSVVTFKESSQVNSTLAIEPVRENRNDSSIFGTKEKVTSAMATTPTLDESPDTVVISSVVASEPAPLPITDVGRVGQGRLLPLRSVLRDFTEVKESPDPNSKTVMSLGAGVVLTAFERHGKWVHIGSNDGSSITGFVLESDLGELPK